MKKIAVVAIWFGKLPDYFPFWVRSLEVNKEYDFLLFTDQEIRIDHPQNLKVQPSTLDALKLQIQNELHISPHFKEPYKFCDYRPAFGELFNKELASYDFWGYCDMDLMFGQLSDFITPDVLERYRKIFNRGHFTLYKNEPEINALYRSSSMINAKEILESADSYIFDEWHGIHEIFNEFGIQQYHQECIADINPNSARFTASNIKNYPTQLFVWNAGSVQQYYIIDGELQHRDLAYIHFQKRDISLMAATDQESNCLLLNSRAFLAYDGEITADLVRKYDQSNFQHYIKRYTKVLLKRLPIVQTNAVTINRSLITRPLSKVT
jgi:uncharacterized protein YehS (DUF1456 family)